MMSFGLADCLAVSTSMQGEEYTLITLEYASISDGPWTTSLYVGPGKTLDDIIISILDSSGCIPPSSSAHRSLGPAMHFYPHAGEGNSLQYQVSFSQLCLTLSNNRLSRIPVPVWFICSGICIWNTRVFFLLVTLDNICDRFGKEWVFRFLQTHRKDRQICCTTRPLYRTSLTNNICAYICIQCY